MGLEFQEQTRQAVHRTLVEAPPTCHVLQAISVLNQQDTEPLSVLGCGPEKELEVGILAGRARILGDTRGVGGTWGKEFIKEASSDA